MSLAAARVLCVGDVMLDRFVTGDVERISPEAPIPILRVGAETSMLGGAGNVIRNIIGLGGSARFVGVIGDDDAGREVVLRIDELGRADAELIIAAKRSTSIKTRFVAGNQQMMRADWESLAEMSENTGAEILAAAGRALAGSDCLVLSDYGKGVFNSARLGALIAAAKTAGKPVIVDPKGSDYDRYRGANLVTPNRKELAEAAGYQINNLEVAMAAAAQLRARHDFGAVLVTLSGDGMILVNADGSVHLPAEAREVFDVSGAGDTVVAAAACALSVKADVFDAASLANVAAGIVVGKVGTAAVSIAEVIAVLHHQDISRIEAKLMSDDLALDRLAVWRRQGFSIGFTNGCFDLLHPGHVSLISQARAACDRLVVGLNSDASVTGLKGTGRPVQTEAARATVLASLGGVDAVVIFRDETPLRLIEMLKPEVLIKGADHAKGEVVGGDFVEANGGRIVLAELAPGHSTTATIARLSGGDTG